MLIKKNNKPVLIRKLQEEDLDQLCIYLQHLSDETKRRFGPHPFDKESVQAFYNASPLHYGFIAVDLVSDEIIAYAIIKLGYLDHDSTRLQSYGLALSQTTDCTFAPSIADAWQGCGLGNHILQFIMDDLKHRAVNRIILWGGVQASNNKAVKFYENNGFIKLGDFQYNGDNWDMIKMI